jgi:endonuclease YncB( thermonuclease family)
MYYEAHSIDRRVARRPTPDVNGQMIRLGDAWVYRHYLRREDRGWCGLESDARKAHRGLWAIRDPVPPWDFRHHTVGRPVPACQ